MTTVTGTLQNPDATLATGLVTHYLIDQDGRQVHNATIAGGTIVGQTYTELVAGAYSVNLTGNADIQAPAGVTSTYWVRSYGAARFTMQVPVSGTWDELQIPAVPPPASPAPVATDLVTSAVIETPVTGLSVVPFFFTTIAGTTVTVPDLAYGVKLEGLSTILCPATANFTPGVFITGPSGRVGVDYHWLGTAALPGTYKPFAVLDPHSGGDYMLQITASTSVTMNVDAQTQQPTGIWVWAINTE
jgi:hypothetical protein